LPSNLTVIGSHRRIVELMMQRSPTFRRQCLRLAHARELTVELRNAFSTLPWKASARTRFAVGRGRLHATIEIKPLTEEVELIAHELEHVIEQLDGVNLRLQALLPNTGVHRGEDGSYETVRAVRAGISVEREFHAADRLVAGR
jgi:hypothetical protein